MKNFIKCSIATLVGGMIVMASLALNGFFAIEEAIIKLMLLTNAFFGVGVIFPLLAVLCWIASDGLFDGLTYSIQRAFYLLTFRGAKIEEKYYDYKQRMAEKRISGYWFLAIVGGGFLVVSGIFLIFFYANGGSDAYKAALGVTEVATEAFKSVLGSVAV